MTDRKATVGFDLAAVLGEAIRRHSGRGCRFRDGAAERLAASPEFAAFASLIEAEEAECPLRAAAA